MTVTFDSPGLAMAALRESKPTVLERQGSPAGDFPRQLQSLLHARRKPGSTPTGSGASTSVDSSKREKLEDLREVSLQLEGVLLRQMFSNMRKTIQQSQLFRRSRAETMFQEQLHDELVDRMAGAGGLGLGNVIYKRLAGRHIDQQTSPKGTERTGEQQ